MWFKNLQLYRLPTPWAITATQLEEKLSKFTFRRCATNELKTSGWRPPRGDQTLVYSYNQQWLLTLESEQRLLPASVVNQLTQERAAELEQQQGYAPGRKQVRELKELVAQELMPRAFTRRFSTRVWIDPKNGWLAVDAGSTTKAEDVLEFLRRSLGDLPLTLINTEQSPVAAMTEWLSTGEAPAGFTVDRDCELKDPGEGSAVVRYVRHALDGDDIVQHITQGKTPTRLALTWNDRLSFVLTERLEVKRLNFLDVVKEDAVDAANADEQFESDFTLMTGELQQFLPELLLALGGETAVI